MKDKNEAVPTVPANETRKDLVDKNGMKLLPDNVNDRIIAMDTETTGLSKFFVFYNKN